MITIKKQEWQNNNTMLASRAPLNIVEQFNEISEEDRFC